MLFRERNEASTRLTRCGLRRSRSVSRHLRRNHWSATFCGNLVRVFRWAEVVVGLPSTTAKLACSSTAQVPRCSGPGLMAGSTFLTALCAVLRRRRRPVMNARWVRRTGTCWPSAARARCWRSRPLPRAARRPRRPPPRSSGPFRRRKSSKNSTASKASPAAAFSLKASTTIPSPSIIPFRPTAPGTPNRRPLMRVDDSWL